MIVTASLLATAHALSARSQCPNLSGKYVLQGEDGQVQITIVQHECDLVEIVRTSNYLGEVSSETHDLTTDGKERKDSPWFGGAEQYRTSARFVGSALEVKTRTNNGGAFALLYSLTRARDLVEEDRSSGGRIRKVAKRQK